jgi:sodium/hydrogen exchanger 8
VAVIAIFKELNADANLHSIVFGESIFNDAIGIVMYETVKELGSGSFAGEIVGAVSKFTIIFGGSLLIGGASALLVAFIQKRQLNFLKHDELEEPNDASFPRTKAEGDLNKRQKHYEQQQTFNSEISMMILCPWVSYLVADGLQLSGIVAILTNGLFLNMYATPNISKGSGKVLTIAYETIAYSAETLVFVFLGIGVFAFDHPLERLGFGSIVLTIINLNIARALNVYVVSALVNRTRSDATKITSDQKFVMWVAGLRGAMAYALSMESIVDYGPAGNIMLSLTLIYALITILIVGSMLNPILDRWTDGVKGGVKDANPEAIAEANPDDGPEGKKKCCSGFKRGLKNFDEKYFAPLFIRKQSEKRSPAKAAQLSPGGTELKVERQASDFSLYENETGSSQPDF